MAAFARRERADLTDLLDSVGPDAPTLCGGWSTYHLVAHLVLREANPLAAAGIVVPVLEKVTDRAMQRLQSRRSFSALVEQVRHGPPRLSPLRPGRVDAAVNTMEFFIHHEDVRRAGTPQRPRALDRRDQGLLWAATRKMGPVLARRTPVGVELVRTDVPETFRIKGAGPRVVVRGLPSELALYASGRDTVADVELSGDETALAAVAAGLKL